MSLSVVPFTGPSAAEHLPAIARLRIRVFREFPYLYDGNMAYEEKYLQHFLEAEDAIVVVAFHAGQVVGVSTGLPLAGEPATVRTPWEQTGEQVSGIYYFSESVLLPEFRGQGIGRRFFTEREAWASARGYGLATFCAVVRPEDHPRRPDDYQPLDDFWRHRGFQMCPGLVCEMRWQDVGEPAEETKVLQFWAKNLRD
ncbi:GNAT family N-acetyltransferase [Neolewinella lacunae]|uniref:GNAT family N-acetyltransferase n=1 Tax=Neolewinella lacunae TaxID=1517758 RepID=A0A923PNA9_9BACT|nr:GNAT family N-acetyltransferase [Neolewinella lacunae]MBC6996599.1 GNAT family N-acetyltransferase [Neolewinella lacunae]MDN3634837.1 GNAT family N-acetyltransferase [Neolewinella lacunae]